LDGTPKCGRQYHSHTKYAAGCTKHTRYFADITDRKWAEEQIKRLNDDLLERNDKLEFANKNSKRLLLGFARPSGTLAAYGWLRKMLQKKLVDDPDKKTHQYMASIIAASKKMERLIDDLLSSRKSGVQSYKGER